MPGFIFSTEDLDLTVKERNEKWNFAELFMPT